MWVRSSCWSPLPSSPARSQLSGGRGDAQSSNHNLLSIEVPCSGARPFVLPDVPDPSLGPGAGFGTGQRYLKRVLYGNTAPFVAADFLFEMVLDYGELGEILAPAEASQAFSSTKAAVGFTRKIAGMASYLRPVNCSASPVRTACSGACKSSRISTVMAGSS